MNHVTTKKPPHQIFLLFLVCIIQHYYICIVETFTITTPSSNNDYQQLASLLVETFDQPPQSASSSIDSKNINNNLTTATTITNTNTTSISNNDQNYVLSMLSQKWEQISWEIYDKFITEQYTFRQYVQNARKMKGKKYSLFLAKEYNPGIISISSSSSSSSSGDVPRPFYEVVGMIELGMVLEPPIIQIKQNDQSDNSRDSRDTNNEIITQQSQQQLLQPRAKVGVLCVNEKHMNKGIGKALIQQCEDVVTNIWNQTQLFVEVEPDNERARNFFQSCGYEICIDENENEIIRNAKVSRRRKVEERPHYVLVKKLCPIIEEVPEPLL